MAEFHARVGSAAAARRDFGLWAGPCKPLATTMKTAFHIAIRDVQEIVIRENIPQRMRILVRNSNRLLVPDRRQHVMVYSRELPTCLFQQVTKLGDCAFFSVEKSHHLRREKS